MYTEFLYIWKTITYKKYKRNVNKFILVKTIYQQGLKIYYLNYFEE